MDTYLVTSHAPAIVHQPQGPRALSHAFLINALAKSAAFLCALKRCTIFSMQAYSLSTPCLYARRYARALRANFRDVRNGSDCGAIEAKMRPWKSTYLFLRLKFCFMRPQSYSMPLPAINGWAHTSSHTPRDGQAAQLLSSPASSQCPLGDITSMCPLDSTKVCSALVSFRKSGQLPRT